MTTLKQIGEFLDSEPLALVGVSRNPRKFGFTAFKELRDKGMNVIPVNPFADRLYNSDVFHDINSLPENIRGLIIMTKKEATAGIIKDALAKGIKQIWIQQGSESSDALTELDASDANYVIKQCILMHYKPNSIHKFHGKLKKFFGLFPS